MKTQLQKVKRKAHHSEPLSADHSVQVMLKINLYLHFHTLGNKNIQR